MRRKALNDLLSWKDRPTRRPLILRGARQVGKSTLARMLAERAFDNLAEINFEFSPPAADIFESMDPKIILPLLEIEAGCRIHPGKTLLFLDEIQAAPKVLPALRYFYERMPDLHVICAGSLLDFALAGASHSMPVGRIEYLFLGPMSFDEFLVALREEQRLEYLRKWSPGDDFQAVIHRSMMSLVRQFLSVGGMPGAIDAWVKTGSFVECDRIQRSILQTYEDDFTKYRERVDTRLLKKTFRAIPGLVGQRFKYTHVARDERSKGLSEALDMLTMARVASRVLHCAGNGIPLGAEINERKFKVLFLDVGLMTTALGLAPFLQREDQSLVNEGAVAEQFVGQHLLYPPLSYVAPELTFWARDTRSSSAEVDYLLPLPGAVSPVEVKAGKTGALRSMHMFLEEKGRVFGLRFNSEPPSLFRGTYARPKSPPAPFHLLSLPIYMVDRARNLASVAMEK